MRIIDTSSDFPSLYVGGQFNLESWKSYIDKWIPGAKELCLEDMRDCINAGYSWSEDFLPVINAVFTHSEKREEAVRSFYAVSEHLDERITQVFGKSVDADIVLYVGLCNGAGWVTEIHDKITVLLGIEKIIELDWCSRDDMTGLIVHELGHVFQAQHGALYHSGSSAAETFLWQLYTEGAAMVFEQEIVGDAEYFHQDKNGWKAWCDRNFALIKNSFYRDLGEMTRENQRYFGDWVRFEGQPDTGYYLGVRFVRYLLQHDCFENVINYTFDRVKTGFDMFMNAD